MENWKDIIGYEDYYQISDCGNIRSKDRMVKSKNNSTSIKKGKIKKAAITNGYRVALLSMYGREKGIGVHRLVARHFVAGMSKERNIVNHIDGNKLNNHASNLEWVTQKENIYHSHIHGLQNPKKGEGHHFSKLSDCDITKIRDLHNEGVSRNEISKKFNISYSSICRIIKGSQRRNGLIDKGLAIDINTLENDK